MTQRRKHRPRPPGPSVAALATAPASNEARQPRLAKLGSAAAVLWYLGGFALLMAGALLQVGPFAWAAAWQVRHWSGDNFVLSFLPGFAVLALPVVLLQLLPRRPEWPFLFGAQNAFSSPPGVPLSRPAPEYMARLLLRLARGGFVVSALCLVAGGVGYVAVLGVGGRGAGQPLPRLSLADTMGDLLPAYAVLTGVVPHPEASWVHDHAIRQTRYHDVYTPLTGPDWHPGDAVSLLEERSHVMDDSTPSVDTDAGGPVEGRLGRGTLPQWMVTELRRSGVAVVDDPVVLARRDLEGVVPGADMVGAILALVMGAVFALFSLGISLAWLYRRRKLEVPDRP